MRAVYDDVCTRAMSTLMSATTPREAVERFVALMVDDPVRGRVLLLAPEVEPVLIQSGRGMDAQLHQAAAGQADRDQRPDACRT